MKITAADSIKTEGNVELVLTNIKTGKQIIEHYKNLVTTLAKEAIADALRGNTAGNRGIITYCALGTGDTAPALGDTGLEAELVRKLISVRSVTNNIAKFETFFTTSEGNGVLKEAGLFGDTASATPGSGILYNHTAISRTKSTSDTLSLAWTFAIG